MVEQHRSSIGAWMAMVALMGFNLAACRGLFLWPGADPPIPPVAWGSFQGPMRRTLANARQVHDLLISPGAIFAIAALPMLNLIAIGATWGRPRRRWRWRISFAIGGLAASLVCVAGAMAEWHVRPLCSVFRSIQPTSSGLACDLTLAAGMAIGLLVQLPVAWACGNIAGRRAKHDGASPGPGEA